MNPDNAFAGPFVPPTVSVAVDVVALASTPEGLKVLLVERRYEPAKGSWALPGGFVEVDEDLEDAARREFFEETGLHAGPLMQIRAFGRPGRDPRRRVVTIPWLTVMQGNDLPEPRAGDDAARAAWHAVTALPPLAFDHGEILAVALPGIGRASR